MLSDLKPYPKYRASGLPWLGKIPEHWEVRRNGRLFGPRREIGFPNLPILEVSIRTGVRIRDLVDGARKQQMADRTKYQRAARGDIAYNMMRMWQGAVGVAPTDGLVSPAYTVARPFPDVDPAYYAYLFRTAAYMREIEVFSRGIVPDRNRLYWESFKQMPSAYPPVGEQQLIVRFLDWHGVQIAKLVRSRKKVIAFLGEQNKAVVHRAVTRGMGERRKLKRSGIEWVGEVPMQWEVCPLRLRYDQALGKMLDAKKITGTSSLPYLRNVDVQWGRINTEHLPEMDISPNEYARYTMEPGDLLVCEGGEVGRAAIWHAELSRCGFQKALHRLRPVDSKRDHPRFFYYVLKAAVAAGAFDDGHKSTISHLTGDKLRAHRFAFPKVEEQITIADYLDEKTDKYERLVQRIKSGIDVLREYHARLIADAVTGAIDVRKRSALLPSSLLEQFVDIYEEDTSEGSEEDPVEFAEEDA